LIQDPEFFDAIRLAAGDELSPAELKHFGSSLASKLATLAPPTAPPPIAATSLKLTTIAKISLPLVIGGLAATYALWPESPEQTQRKTVLTPIVENTLDAGELQVDLSALAHDLDRNVEDTIPDKPARRHNKSRDPMNADAPKPAPGSLIPEQLGLFRAAKIKAHEGRFQEALGILEQLEIRFPNTALRAEIALSRAEYLALAGQTQKAIVAVQKVLANPAYRGKRAELLRLLGDLWLKAGRCDRAQQAYKHAISEGLDSQKAAEAYRGLQKCKGQ
ncbi:MAG: hypothetical protein V1754_12980, partial [Pseudomonadota bacterium]